VRAVTGEPFEIFQDVDGIGIGEHWPDKMVQMLDEARFFIPILTPSHFNSTACRDDKKFLRAEAKRGRNDLVLPIYYIECDVLEHPHLRAADPLAAEICRRQHHNWRELRFSSSFSTKAVRKALHRLATDIDRARRRSMPKETAPQTRASAQVSASRPEQMAAVPSPPAVAMPRRAAAATSSAELLARAALTWERSTDLGRSTQVNLQDTLALPDHGVTSRPETLRPGTVFRDIDAPWCPELVVIPPGEFLMGAPEGEEDREEFEGPQHLVKIGYPLAVGRYADFRRV
jgi:hypothetical protein